MREKTKINISRGNSSILRKLQGCETLTGSIFLGKVTVLKPSRNAV